MTAGIQQDADFEVSIETLDRLASREISSLEAYCASDQIKRMIESKSQSVMQRYLACESLLQSVNQKRQQFLLHHPDLTGTDD